MSHRIVRAVLALPAGLICALGVTAPARERGVHPQPAAQVSPDEGAHGFDFELGRWRIHIRQARNPLGGGCGWNTFDGTTVNCSLWPGSEIQRWEADGASGRIEGLTLRLYDRKSRRWTLYGADRPDGALQPPVVGEFRHGQGVFLDREAMDGRMVLVRSVWSGITPNAVHFEASASEDAGRTWRAIMISDQTRLGPARD